MVVNYPRSGHVRKLPRVQASAFVIADARTGQVLAARDPHGWYRPASTLKVLTAISLIPALNPHATTVASHEAATTEPNDVGLKAGRHYKISDLFRALLTISANDAAVALAQATGSLHRGLALMNAEAHKLQARDTVAKDPNGLDARGPAHLGLRRGADRPARAGRAGVPEVRPDPEPRCSRSSRGTGSRWSTRT